MSLFEVGGGRTFEFVSWGDEPMYGSVWSKYLQILPSERHKNAFKLSKETILHILMACRL